jgi:glycosyltransferase involved in cell wall biosynthesis
LTGNPLVSVLVPAYNRGALLRQALASVAEQDYRPIEVAVVDDGSDDDTQSVIRDARILLERAQIELVSDALDANSGPAAARNAGLKLVTGSLVAFLDSDDLWRPTFLTTVVQLLDRHPTCGVAFTGIELIDSEGDVTGVRDLGLAGGLEEGTLQKPFEVLATRFPFITVSTLTRRHVLDAVGPFDETLALWSDADLWYRVGKRFDFAYTRKPLACHRDHEGNITKGRLHGGLDWLYYQLLVSLRHLNDIRDPSTRDMLTDRIKRWQVLLQEQLLREGRRDGDLHALLVEAKPAPTSVRYRLGQLVMHGPDWVGRCYASAIRVAGGVARMF